MNLILEFSADFNCSSKSSKSKCLYLNLLALLSLIPSITDAWFKASEITASESFKIASKNPAFASKQLEYKIESSVEWKSEIVDSNFLSKSCVPEIKVT